MPLYAFHCTPCGLDVSRLFEQDPAKGPVVVLCPSCRNPVQRKARGPSTRIVEVLDNGVMTKRLERLSDAERLYWERNKKPDQD